MNEPGLPVLPGDADDARLVACTHPLDRTNPAPADRYQLVVVGGGPAGLVAAFGAAGLGARVALVERGLLGGDCLAIGCVPSKALLASAHAAAAARRADALGVCVGDVTVDFPAVMARMRRLRADLAPHDAVRRLEAAGIHVFLGDGRFTGPDALVVDGRTLRFSRAVIATGARAARPSIPGLDAVEPLDNETLFTLTELPARLVVLGGGPIGVEMAQAFARFGSEVILVDRAPRVLHREDPDASEIVRQALVRDGVRCVLRARVVRAEREGDDRVVVVERDGREERLVGDAVLLALGRRPNVETLGLEQAGVEVDRGGRGGVETDEHLCTSNPRIYAAGDVVGPLQFTHAADAQARVVLQNALVVRSRRSSGLVIPWATYTDPEVAHVGPTHEELARRSDLQVFTERLADTDRGVTDGTTEGFARVHADGRGRIVAATLVGPGAGDLINEVSLAMTHGLGLGSLASTVHTYPTRAEVLRKLGDAYNRTRLTPVAAGVLRRWLRWRHG